MFQYRYFKFFFGGVGGNPCFLIFYIFIIISLIHYFSFSLCLSLSLSFSFSLSISPSVLLSCPGIWCPYVCFSVSLASMSASRGSFLLISLYLHSLFSILLLLILHIIPYPVYPPPSLPPLPHSYFRFMPS